MIDLRSDTVTKPTPTMLESMMKAEVGDDVFKSDPTVNKLEEVAAEMFGMEASLFCPSGTMTNQIGIFLGSGPLTEVITEKESHVYLYEGGGISFNSSASVKLVEGDRGRLTSEQVLSSINPEDDHKARTSLVCLENTCNKGGGTYYDLSELKKINTVTRNNGLRLHLDGARLFNALAETGESPKEYGKLFDTISICLSKGLGAPIGSLLLGSHKDIKYARRIRKVMGGGMRQVGFLAAAGLYALEHNRERLKIDHQRAKNLGEVLESCSYVDGVLSVKTNIVIATLKCDVGEFLGYLKEKNILAVQFGPMQIRLVTHLDFSDEMLKETIQTLKSFIPR